MLPRRVFKKYWCSIQYPYLKLSGQNRPQSLVFCKSSTWDSFVHPALSTIPVKYHKNYTSPKPPIPLPGGIIHHPPKPQAILRYPSDSVINLLSLSLLSQDFQCPLWNLCLYWLSFLYPLPLWFFILQTSSKQNKTKQKCSWDKCVLVLQNFKKFLPPPNFRPSDLTACHASLVLSFPTPWGFQ